MDTPFLHIALLIIGFLSGSILFSFVLTPIFYGLPHLLSWSVRRYLEWRALLLYALPPLLWACAFSVVAYYSGILFRLEIVRSAAFGGGLCLAIVAKAGKLGLYTPARRQIRTQLLNFATPYLTAKGAASLRGLWPKMPQNAVVKPLISSGRLKTEPGQDVNLDEDHTGDAARL